MSRSRYSSDRYAGERPDEGRPPGGRYADDPYERGGRRNEPRRPAGGGNKGGPGGSGPGGSGPGGTGPFQFNVGTLAILAGVLVVGIGIGTAISSTTQGDQGNIASSQQLDMAVPDPEFCRQWGASAFVMDVELYTTMNPSSSLRPAALFGGKTGACCRRKEP